MNKKAAMLRFNPEVKGVITYLYKTMKQFGGDPVYLPKEVLRYLHSNQKWDFVWKFGLPSIPWVDEDDFNEVGEYRKKQIFQKYGVTNYPDLLVTIKAERMAKLKKINGIADTIQRKITPKLLEAVEMSDEGQSKKLFKVRQIKDRDFVSVLDEGDVASLQVSAYPFVGLGGDFRFASYDTTDILKRSVVQYVDFVEKEVSKYMSNRFPNLSPTTFKIDWGKRYARIVASQGPSVSAFGFIDLESGDILKAASWKQPAKNARGNVEERNTWARSFGPYGIASLKRAASDKKASPDTVGIAVYRGRKDPMTQDPLVILVNSENQRDIDSTFALQESDYPKIDPKRPFLVKYNRDEDYVHPVPLRGVH
jgi:hypothetical protein